MSVPSVRNEKMLTLIILIIFIQSITSYISQKKIRPRTSHTECFFDQHFTTLVSSAICSNVDINWSQFAFQGAVAGGCRALSRGLTFPFDTLKTLEQISTPASDSLKDICIKPDSEDTMTIIRKLLSKDYFRGIIPAVASAVPANAVFFVVYNYLQTIAASECVLKFLSIGDISFYQKTSVLFVERLLFSAVATLPQNAIKIPAELIKQRAQIQPEANIFSLFKQATNSKLGLRGLYQGGGAQLIREIPYNAIQMATFQLFKETLLLDISTSDGLYLGLNLASISAVLGLFAAAIAALLTQPADVIKTRLMTTIENENEEIEGNEKIITNSKNNMGIIRTSQQILEEEGWKGFFVGLGPRLILVSLGGMVYFYAAEVATEIFQVSLAK